MNHESIVLTDANTGDSIHGLITHQEPLKLGSATKTRVEVSSLNEQGEDTLRHFVLRTVDYLPERFDSLGDTLATRYAGIWQELQRRGLPTLPAVYIVSPDVVGVPDLGAQDIHLYGNHLQSVVQHSWEYQPTTSDNVFLDLSIPAIEAAAHQAARQASQADVVLPSDDPMKLQLNPDGTWSIVAPFDIDKTVFTPDTYHRNRESAIDFTHHMVYLQNKIRQANEFIATR